MDVNVRKLRYFVAVADELHFSRAAGRLLIAQQSLSKQIRELEDQVGTPLFFRTRRSVELTPAGIVFLERIRPLLADLDQAVAATRLVGGGETGTLQIGFGMFAALELTSHILDEFNRRHPTVEVEMREFALSDQTAGLADGWADVALIRPPLAAKNIDFELLFVEPRVLSISRHHPLAARSELSVADVLPLTLSVGSSDDEDYLHFWSLDDFRDEPAPRLRRTATNTEELQLVAAGLACTVNPAAVQRYLPHDDVRCVPIRDVPGSAVAVAWRRDRPNRLTGDFVAAAHAVVLRERAVVERIEHPTL